MNRRHLVYLDYAATTPVDSEIAAAMADCLQSPYGFANPSSNHVAGRQSAELVERARAQVGALLNAEPRDLAFTSGATESNNLAIFGAARHRAHRGKHLITMTTEHKSVIECFEALQREGFDVTWLDPDKSGKLDPQLLEAAIRDDTQLVSVMHINNETGVIQDIASIAAICHRRDVLYHCDAAQSAGKLPLDIAALGIDLLSLTGHKFYGPQGAGALFVADRPGCQLEPLLFGGSQERRRRPGTHAVHQILGLGLAAELALSRLAADLPHCRRLRERLWLGIRDLPGLCRNGDEKETFAGILNVSTAGVDGESLMLALEPLCVARGSACNAQSGESSFVLRAMGRSDALAQSAIRFSFGRETTNDDIDVAIERFRWAVNHLGKLRPPETATATRA
ncbi:MAG: aminotransferase class V-fold PLP-dependent enzyme [Gammaproteobacteria bacterium]|nr:aminotransferase class V-fold PLP-dependent enzyme [Gammaproteobacteria bacterium]MDH4313810.1 aminotransferase class V-fold PLP-dependent enzyme [Gammaproteobacteria bacterium]MDH5214811.1 aminotransferase class V-fold PLP-dependent enzyme [Gammaproteobacteria bacterium]MDH5501947.1 aminotransferase class V-fold PLP-dependent enzyme [Gammaproteobacteria bacterium]